MAGVRWLSRARAGVRWLSPARACVRRRLSPAREAYDYVRTFASIKKSSNESEILAQFLEHLRAISRFADGHIGAAGLFCDWFRSMYRHPVLNKYPCFAALVVDALFLRTHKVRNSMDWQLVRNKAAEMVEELVYKAPDLKERSITRAARTAYTITKFHYFCKPLKSYLCVMAGKLMCFSDKALQAGNRVVLNQGHPPEYLPKGGFPLVAVLAYKSIPERMREQGYRLEYTSNQGFNADELLEQDLGLGGNDAVQAPPDHMDIADDQGQIISSSHAVESNHLPQGFINAIVRLKVLEPCARYLPPTSIGEREDGCDLPREGPGEAGQGRPTAGGVLVYYYVRSFAPPKQSSNEAVLLVVFLEHLRAINCFAHGQTTAASILCDWFISIHRHPVLAKYPCFAALVDDVLFLHPDRVRSHFMSLSSSCLSPCTYAATMLTCWPGVLLLQELPGLATCQEQGGEDGGGDGLQHALSSGTAGITRGAGTTCTT
ncbi:hypothetical protein BAE44_0019588 [Dichanthelium oligosanthes]|uniref:Uncharacterized protein n=1 Tax=Dichanthelium oligosanthes TaxID=888268 RepID=A0A1E5V2J9_9POAL|nr:hypothetical protein BAE44_0019588 [Dichanthelium oligosanthes]